MLLQALTTARDLGRLQVILGVLIRHGFGDTVRRLGVADALENAGENVRMAARNIAAVLKVGQAF